MFKETRQQRGAITVYFRKELHMSDYEVITIVLIVLGLVLIGDSKWK